MTTVAIAFGSRSHDMDEEKRYFSERNEEKGQQIYFIGNIDWL